MNQDPSRILVIKLSALGDFIQATGPMKAIRAHHPDANITLLTTKPFVKFAEKCGYFDEIWVDERPKWFNFLGWRALKKRLVSANFTRIYDLQNNDRTQAYFNLFPKPKPEWVGAAKGASHRNASPDRTAGHAFDGHVQTLALAGIQTVDIDDLSWMDGDLSSLNLKKPYALLIPGCAPMHPYKRWPAESFGHIANFLSEKGYQPVLIGTQDDQAATDLIAQHCPQALNLTHQTNLEQIAALGRGAAMAIGNDTGPMHLIAATGCPCLSLFSGKTSPIKHGPKGKNVRILQGDPIDFISIDAVQGEINRFNSKD